MVYDVVWFVKCWVFENFGFVVCYNVVVVLFVVLGFVMFFIVVFVMFGFFLVVMFNVLWLLFVWKGEVGL